MRVAIAGLMALLALLAVEVAALRFAGDERLDACRLLTVATLVAATFHARGRAGGGGILVRVRRAGWVTYLSALDSMGDHSGSMPGRTILRLLASLDLGPNATSACERAMRPYRLLQLLLALPSGPLGGCVGWLLDRRKRRPP